MITNPDRLLKGVPPITVQHYKLLLVEHFLLKPLAEVFDFTITSAYRTLNRQANLTDASGNTVPETKKAKGVSQHCMGEAVDIDGRHNRRMYMWLLEHARPWQLILYLEEGKTSGLHISIPSENEAIQQKTLLNVDGDWQWYRGEFPAEE